MAKKKAKKSLNTIELFSDFCYNLN